jgi:hypothetical protein
MALPIASLVCTLAFFPGGASAQSQPGFKMPSNNVYCIIEQGADGQSASDLRCDLQQTSSRRPPPGDCPLSWGDAFSITADGDRGRLVCHGDTTKNDDLPVLPYGEHWDQDGYSCKSETSGVTCVNGAGHGFMLSRAVQRVF